MADIFGTAGPDSFTTGNSGSDRYFLFGGDDFVRPGAGTDEVFGGTGSDTISYFTAAGAVILNMDTQSGAGSDAQGDTWTSVERLSGSGFNDIFTASDARAGTYFGNGGDDQFKGAGSADSFVGGAGRDAVSYANSDAAVVINAGSSSGSGGDAAGDTYTSIERFRGSDFNDRFFGSTADDEFEGGDGNDTFKGSAGADTFNGGAGFDVVDYSASGAAVVLTGATGLGGDAAGDEYISIEGGRGSGFDDTIGGTDADNRIEGLNGNDYIKGAAGDDSLLGGNGNDTLEGDEGADTLNGGAGDDILRPGEGGDTIDGGAGIDTLSYSTSSALIIANMETGTGLGGDATGDSWTGIERISGTNFGDSFTSSDSQGTTFFGLNGDDTFKGAAGADSFSGGAGRDAVSYQNSDEGVIISAGSSSGAGGDAAGDTYSSIERFRGSDFNDRFFGSTADDEFEGLDGDDTFKGSAGADTFNGGDGFDVVDYSASSAAITILAGGIGTGGDAAGDEYISIEGGRGSAFNDTLGGTDVDNRIEGLNGNDLIKGVGGNDSLLGGNGDDTLQGGDGADYLGGGAGADVMEGGLGNDFYIVDDVGDVVQGEIAFSSGGGIDTVRSFIDYTQPDNIELVRLGNITGTTNLNAIGNDAPGTLVGNAGNNSLTGRGGDDQLNGNDGDDRIIGNTGVDTIVGGAGADTFVYTSISESRAGASERDVINGFDRGATQDIIDLSGIDAVQTSFGDDAFNFIGNAGFSGTAGELRTQGLGGPNAILVEGDINGNGNADFQIFVNLQTQMFASDFIL